MSQNDIVDVETIRPEAAARADGLRTWGWVSYLLHLIVAVAAVVPGAQVSIALLIIAVMGPGFSTMVLSVGVVAWTPTARLVRSMAAQALSTIWSSARGAIGRPLVSVRRMDHGHLERVGHAREPIR